MIREMVLEDLDQVLALEKQCFAQPWTLDNLRYELEGNPFSHGWVLIDEEEIVGYTFLWETFETGQIAKIGVDPKKRRKHFADQLMKAMDHRAVNAGCEVITLEVRASNVAARKLYEKNGYIQMNISKKYYPDGEDAIIMTKPVGGLD